MIDNTTSLQTLLNTAIAALNDVAPGEEFTVKELFRGFEWKRVQQGYRIKLGGMFFDYAKKDGAALLMICGKTPQNQQIYRRL